MTHLQRMLPLELGATKLKQFGDAGLQHYVGTTVNTRTRALQLARDSVAQYAEKHEPEALQRIQRVWNRDKMRRTTIADKQGWAPAADVTAEAEALGLKGHTLGRIRVGEEDVQRDLDLDVTWAVVTNRVTSDAHAAELVAHTRVLQGLRSGTHQYQKIMAAHILSVRVESERRTRASA
jgi:hypothetical protein